MRLFRPHLTLLPHILPFIPIFVALVDVGFFSGGLQAKAVGVGGADGCAGAGAKEPYGANEDDQCQEGIARPAPAVQLTLARSVVG